MSIILTKPILFVRSHFSCFWKGTILFKLLKFLNNRHPNVKFTTEKQVNHSIAFLDVFISGIDNQNLTLQEYHKLPYTGLLLDFHIFPYKISLIKCLIDRFKIVRFNRLKYVTIKNLFIMT